MSSYGQFEQYNPLYASSTPYTVNSSLSPCIRVNERLIQVNPKPVETANWAIWLLITVILVIFVIIFVWILWPRSSAQTTVFNGGNTPHPPTPVTQVDSSQITSTNPTSTSLAGGVCGGTVGCAAGLSCVNGICKRQIGQPCLTLSECVPQATQCSGGRVTPGGAVIYGICTDQPSGGLNQPAPCIPPYQPNNNNICKAPVQSSCVSNTDCLTGVCLNGQCANKREIGQTCQLTSDNINQCINGASCSNGYCQPNGFTTGQEGAFCNVQSNPGCNPNLLCINQKCTNATLILGESCDPQLPLCQQPLICRSITNSSGVIENQCLYIDPVNSCPNDQCLVGQDCQINTLRCQGELQQPCALASQCSTNNNTSGLCLPNPLIYRWLYQNKASISLKSQLVDCSSSFTFNFDQLKAYSSPPRRNSQGDFLPGLIKLVGLIKIGANSGVYQTEIDQPTDDRLFWTKLVPALNTCPETHLKQQIVDFDFLPDGTILTIVHSYAEDRPEQSYWRLFTIVLNCSNNSSPIDPKTRSKYLLRIYGDFEGYQYGRNGGSSLLLRFITGISISSTGDILLTSFQSLWLKSPFNQYFERIEGTYNDILSGKFYPSSSNKTANQNYAFIRSNNLNQLIVRGQLAGTYPGNNNDQTEMSILYFTGLALVNANGIISPALLLASGSVDNNAAGLNGYQLIQFQDPQVSTTQAIRVYSLPGYFNNSILIASPRINQASNPVNPLIWIFNSFSCSQNQ